MSRSAPLPRLHVVTDDAVLARPDFRAVAAAVMEAAGSAAGAGAGAEARGAAAAGSGVGPSPGRGVDPSAGRGAPPPVLALHVRGPTTSGRILYEHVRALLPVARGSAMLLFVNDRVDVALATSPDGIHLGRRSLRPRDARPLVGPRSWLGASAGSVEEVGNLTAEGVDYTFLGTIWPTASHPGREGSGPEALAAAVERARAGAASNRTAGTPVLAIGGVTPERVAAVRAAGAWGVAVLGGVWSADRPADAVARYLSALETT